MSSFYSNQPPRAFWRAAVRDRAPLDPGEVYRPKFGITRKHRVVTAGSCFAQHVGRTLRAANFDVVDTEPAPAGLPEAEAKAFGYNLYSARYGNIYTARQLNQLSREALGRLTPALPVWTRGERFYDAQRPNVEPEGLASEELVLKHRESHLRQVQKAFRSADLVVFTFGLTEAWIHTETGTVYPTAPGTIAGQHDEAVFSFKNYTHSEVMADFVQFRSRMMRLNPEMRFLVTVSPVPLAATATPHHVEVATSYSKAVLRAVCGEIYEAYDNVDYFPSYEIITSQNARGVYYEPDKRNVSQQGVGTAMSVFLAAHDAGEGAAPPAPEPKAATRERPGRAERRRARENREAEADVVCEEALLEAFQKT